MTISHLLKSRFPAAASIAVLASALLSSCSIIGLGSHVETMESRGGVAIQIIPPPKVDPPTYALAWRMENGQRKDSAGFQGVGPSGIAAFNLRMDSAYRVGAFTDENRNGAYDAGEPGGFLVDVKPASLSDPSVMPKLLKITLTRDHGFAPGTVIHVPKENKELGGKTNLALGEVVSLDDKRFSEDVRGSGLWRPLDFLSGNRQGIYFTEPYDPKRIPVVFVYGMGGSPQDMRYFIEHFDRKKYQLWFYHYPSGMRLDRVSSVLATGLRLLKQRDGFSKCYVVAHSMGGLVARTAITQAVAAEGVNFIPKFVSISTPWGGSKAAETGIGFLKKPVPSWLDLKPDSNFLLRLYETPLPKGTSHDLIYGSIEDGAFWMDEKNDGMVTVASETDIRVKKGTRSFKHLAYEHVDILKQPETLSLVQRDLAR